MTINAADLDPATRKRLGLPTSSRKRPRTTQRTGPHEPVAAGYWRCNSCPYTSSVWTRMERHAAEQQHSRIDIDLTRATDPKESNA